MNSVSSETKNHDGFLEHIKDLAYTTKNGYKSTLRGYEMFLQDEYGQSTDEIILSLRAFHLDWQKSPEKRSMFTENLSNTTYEQLVIQHLQDFVKYLKTERICPKCEGQDNRCKTCRRTGIVVGKRRKACRSNVTKIKAYLRYFGLMDGVTERNIECGIKYPKEVEEEPMPFEKSMLQQVIKETIDSRRRTLYTVLAHSGLRIIEASALRKDNFIYVDRDGNRTTKKNFVRIQIFTDPNFTKFGIQRKTFVSEEVQDEVIGLLESVTDEQPIFVKNKNPHTAEANEERAFALLRERLAKKISVFGERYESGTHKISIHSFRSYFITCANKIDHGFGHALAGHKPYMSRYNRLTAKEKIDFYMLAEAHLSTFTQVDTKTIEMLEEKQKQIDQLNTKAKTQEMSYVELLMMVEQQNKIIKQLQTKQLKIDKAFLPPAQA